MGTEHTNEQDNVVQMPTENVNILDRDGALAILRSMREDIRRAGEAGQALWTLSPTEAKLNYLKNVLDQQTAQMFAMLIMLSRLMADPDIEAEVAADLEET